MNKEDISVTHPSVEVDYTPIEYESGISTVGRVTVDEVQEKTVDKKILRQKMTKVFKVRHFDGIPVIAAEEQRTERHNLFEELFKELELIEDD
jgi:hypothetical protein